MDIIQIIWLAIPAFLLLIGLYGLLEKLGKSVKRQNPKDHFKSGFFALVCTLICLGIDNYLLADLVGYLPEFIPPLFFRIILYPVVLYLLAVSIGGTTPTSLKKPQGR